MGGLTAADARGRVSAIREGLSSAMRDVSVPSPDWRRAARSLLDAARAANDLALRCLDEGCRAEAANGLSAGGDVPPGVRAAAEQLAGVGAVVWDEFDSHKE